MDDLRQQIVSAVYEACQAAKRGRVGPAAQEAAETIVAAIEHHSTPDSSEAGDTARLDWLAAHVDEFGGLILHSADIHGNYAGLGLRAGRMNRTLRDAIDAAMSAPDTARTPEVSDG